MKKNKKLKNKIVLSLTTAAAIAAPVVSIVSCGRTNPPSLESLLDYIKVKSNNHIKIDADKLASVTKAPLTKDIADKLGIKWPSDLKGAELKYSIEKTLSSNGSVKITIFANKKGTGIKETSYTVEVAGIDEYKLKRDVLDKIQNTLSITLSKDDLNGQLNFAQISNQTLDSAKATKLGITLPTLPQDVTLTYSTDKELTQDGDLKVTITAKTAKKGNATSSKDITIHVKGIDEAKKAALYNLIKNIKNTSSVTLSNDKLNDQLNLDKVTNKSLNTNPLGIQLPKTLPQGVTLTYTHPELTKDGKLIVTIKATKDGVTSDPKTVTVTVLGIDEHKSIKGVLDNIQNTTATISVEKLDEVTSGTTLYSNNPLGITLPSDLKGATLTYTHPELTKDGKLTVTIKATKDSITFSKEINVVVTGIDEYNVENLLNKIQNTSPITLSNDKLNDQLNLDKVTNKSLNTNPLGIQLPKTLPQGVTLTYTHPELTQDGNLKVTITAKKGNATSSKDITVHVSGINKAKAEKTLKDYLESASFDFSKLKIKNESDLNNFKNSGNISNDTETNKLGITFNKNKPNNVSNIKYTSKGLNNNKLTIEIKGTIKYNEKGNEGTSSYIKDLDLNMADIQQTIDDLNALLKQIEGKDLNLTNTVKVPEVLSGTELSENTKGLIFKKGGITLPSDLKGATLTYSHPELTKDGNLKVTIEAEKNGISVKKDITINIKGINQAKKEAKFKAEWQKLLDIYLTGGLLNILGRSSISNNSWKEIKTKDTKIPKVIWDKYDKDNQKDHNISIYLSNGELDNDGPLSVKFVVKDNNQEIASKEVTYKITGIDEFKRLNDLINGIQDVDLRTTQSIQAVNSKTILDSNNPLGINLPNNSNGATLTYSHPELTQDGDLKVTIFATASDNNRSNPKVVIVHVSGIDEQKLKKLLGQIQNTSPITLSKDDLNDKLNFAKISNQSLDSTKARKLGITLPTLPQGVTLTYSTNKELTQDGYLKVTITAKKGKATSSKDITVHVSGIDEQKLKKLLGQIQNTQVTLSKDDLNNQLNFAQISNQPLDSTKATKLGITLPSLNGVTLTYSTDKELTQDGDLTVTITATKDSINSSKTITANVNIKNAREAKLNELLDQITVPQNQITIYAENFGTSNGKTKPLDTNIIKNLQLENFSNILTQNGVTLTYSTDKELTQDGDLTVTIKATKGNVSSSKTLGSIKIKLIKDQDVEQINSILVQFSKGKILQKDVLKIDAKQGPFNENAANYLHIAYNNTFPSIPKDVTLTYSHPELIENGKLKVTITGTLNGKNSTKIIEIPVTGITETKLKDFLNQINSNTSPVTLSKGKLNDKLNFAKISNQSLDSTKAKKLGITLPTLPQGVTLTYSTDKELTQDGDLTVTITATKGGVESTTTQIIQIKGIDEAKAKKHEEKIKHELEQLLNGISIKEITASKDDLNDKFNFAQITNKPLDSSIIQKLGITLLTLSQDVNLTYSTDKELIQDGDLKVTINASKDGITSPKKINVSVKGINNAIQTKLNELLGQITVPQNQITIYAENFGTSNGKTQPLDTNNKLKLGNIPDILKQKDIALTYSTDKVLNTQKSTTGNLKVTIKATKGNVSSSKTLGPINVKLVADKDIEKIEEILNQFSQGSVLQATLKIDAKQDIAFNKNAANYLHIAYNNTFPSIPQGMALTYSHPELTENGKLKVTITGTWKGKNSTKIIEIPVTGITERLLKEIVDGVTFQNSSQGTLTIDITNENLVDQNGNVSEILDKEVSKIVINNKQSFKINILDKDIPITLLNSLALPEGAKLTFSTNGNLSNDGEWQISFKATKGNITANSASPKTINVQGINKIKDQRILDNINITIPSGLKINAEKLDLVQSGTILDSTEAKKLGITLPKLPQGVTLTYSTNKKLTNNGEVEVTIKAKTNNDAQTEFKQKIDITGIDKTKTNALLGKYINSANYNDNIQASVKDIEAIQNNNISEELAKK